MDLSGLTDAQIDALIQAEQDQEEKHEMEKQDSPSSVSFEGEELEAPSRNLPYNYTADDFKTTYVGGKCNTTNAKIRHPKTQKPRHQNQVKNYLQSQGQTPKKNQDRQNDNQNQKQNRNHRTYHNSNSKVKPSSEPNNRLYHKIYKQLNNKTTQNQTANLSSTLLTMPTFKLFQRASSLAPASKIKCQDFHHIERQDRKLANCFACWQFQLCRSNSEHKLAL
jgi:hypothetical protein